jgi:hypothetical protein
MSRPLPVRIVRINPVPRARGILRESLGKGHETSGWMDNPYYPLILVSQEGRVTR